jgi:transposase
MRQQAIKAVREGQTVSSVATAYGVNERSVFRWLASFIEGGQKALLAKPIPGRPMKLSDEQMRWIANTVRENTPQQLKFEFGLWTLKLIRHLIKRQFGVELSTATAHRVMKTLGFSVQKPLYQAWQQDPVMVRTWEAEAFPAIAAEARRVGASIYFADESGIRSDYHTGTTWAPKGQTPVVAATGRRFSLNMISAINPRGELRFMLHDGTVTARIFLEFLKRLMVGAQHPIFLIVDGHPIHRSKMVRTYVDSLQGKLQLFFLPPYAPHLNPDEVVWAHVKREVSGRLVQSKDEMKRLALSALRRIQKLPELIKSFFGQPECSYIQM